METSEEEPKANRKRKTTEDPVKGKEPEKKKKKEKSIALAPNQYTGKACMVHNCTVRSSKAFPKIHVGKYRSFLLCKQSHLKDEKELDQIEKTFIQEIDTIKEKGDGSSVNRLYNDSEDEEDDVTVKCAGLMKLSKNGSNPSKCTTTMSAADEKLLWIQPKGEHKAYFCEFIHLSRYLMHYNCRGRKGGTSKVVDEAEDKHKKTSNTKTKSNPPKSKKSQTKPKPKTSSSTKKPKATTQSQPVTRREKDKEESDPESSEEQENNKSGSDDNEQEEEDRVSSGTY